MSGDRSGWGDSRPGLGIDALIVSEYEVGEAALALASAGIRVRSRIDWRSFAAGPLVPPPLVIAEAEEIAPDLLAAGLARLADYSKSAATQLAVSFTVDQLDQVAAALLGDHVELLCAPSRPAWIAAVSLAAFRARPQGGVREAMDEDMDDAAERLRRINDEIARIADAIAGAAVPRPRAAPDAATDSDLPAPAALNAADLRRALRARRLREQYLGPGLFEDPAWDMLLDLAAAELEGKPVSVSSLCIAAAVAPTTALRWINRLLEAGLVERTPDPIDRRRAYMALTPAARAAMHAYVHGLAAAGIALA